MSPEQAMAAMTKAMRADLDGYAWSWHCMLACMAQDAGASHEDANKTAASYMLTTFGVDTSKSSNYHYSGAAAQQEQTMNAGGSWSGGMAGNGGGSKGGASSGFGMVVGCGAGGSGGVGHEPPKPVSLAQEAFKDLEDAQASLTQAVDRLIKSLEPVMSPPSADGCGVGPSPARPEESEFVSAIRRSTRDIRYVTNLLVSAQDRLEI